MSKSLKHEAIEAEIVKDNDGKKARKKVEIKSKFNNFFLPIIADLILLIFGICLLAWVDKVTSLISIVIGSFFIIYAAYNFIGYARANADKKPIAKIIIGVAMIIAGIFLCAQTDFIKESISFIIGVFIIIISIMRLQDSLSYRSKSNNYQLPVILSIIGITTGLLCILGKIMISDFVLQILGIMLIIFSVSNIINSISIKKLNSK